VGTVDAWVMPLSIGAGAAVGVGVVVLGAFLLRSAMLTRRLGSFDCSWRSRGRTGAAWMLGVARFEADRLDWYRIFTVRPRPVRSLTRTSLRILGRSRAGHSGRGEMPGSVILHCEHGATRFDLAMSESAAHGLAMWLESAPPGQRASLG
jgi:hypothetical protein